MPEPARVVREMLALAEQLGELSLIESAAALRWLARAVAETSGVEIDE